MECSSWLKTNTKRPERDNQNFSAAKERRNEKEKKKKKKGEGKIFAHLVFKA